MQSLNAFINRTLRQRITAPGGLGGECVDLTNEYLRACYGAPHVFRNAVDWATVVLPGWRWEANGPTNVPPHGAIVVWQQAPVHGIGVYGHVAIAVDGDPMLFLSYDQNWPDGAPCQFNEHDYVGVLGWHRPPLT